jgi:hypothetical protein
VDEEHFSSKSPSAKTCLSLVVRLPAATIGQGLSEHTSPLSEMQTSNSGMKCDVNRSSEKASPSHGAVPPANRKLGMASTNSVAAFSRIRTGPSFCLSQNNLSNGG